jgi:serine/threonine protein kinase
MRDHRDHGNIENPVAAVSQRTKKNSTEKDAHASPDVVRFRGRTEPVIDTIRLKGRKYFVLENLSRRGAVRVFDPQAGPHGDFRVLYRLPHARATRQTIETLRRLGGPTANRNFPVITDCVRQGDELFVVMSWAWGTDLRMLLRSIRGGESPRPSVPEIVRLFRGLAHGLTHFHRHAALVHGDLSPANLILTSRPTQLVLIDFGSAWPVEQTATKNAGDGVTFPYVAPERIHAQASEDFRADQFSLAVIAYELLTLEIPYDGLGGRAELPMESGNSTTRLIAPSKRLPWRQRRVPSDSLQLLDAVLCQSLGLHPDERFLTPGEWLDAWDRLHFSLRGRGRLSRPEKWSLDWIEFLARPFFGRQRPDQEF